MNLVIGFSRSKHKLPLLGWLIMFCERTRFSHTYLRIRSESLDEDLIYQANASGIYFTGKDVFESHNQVVREFQIKISDTEKRVLLKWCIQNSGKPYGKLQLLGVAIKRLIKLFGVNVKNPFANGETLQYCSEVVARATQHLSIKLVEVDFDSIGLKEVYQYAEAVSHD